jgi:hypothetical protein
MTFRQRISLSIVLGIDDSVARIIIDAVKELHDEN